MTELLIKLFITNKMKEKISDSELKENPEIRGKYANLASVTGILINVFLSITKLIVGIIASSISIISDALNNITDIGSSLITLIGFKLSRKKSDKDHPWGHGRIEYLTGFIVDMIIIFVGLELLKSSVEKIIHPSVPSISIVTIVLLVIAIFAKLWLFIFYKKIGKLIDSAAMDGVAYDSISDTISTTAVLISAIVAKLANISIDGFVSLMVSIFILITGIKAIKEMVDMLIGTGPDEEFIKEIKDFVKNYPEIAGIHDIMVHDYGPGRKIVSFHAEVPSDSDICEAHDVIDGIEASMHKKFNCITTIHMDPIVVNDEEINLMKEKVTKVVTDINENYTIHDFRMTNGGKIINVIFDLAVPFEENVDFKELEKEVKEKIKTINKNCNAVVTVEHTF
jgi:cation diffusion facilitator family transporter